MAARESMADLIARLRGLIGDAAGTGQTFDDEELEQYLDARRTEHRYRRLQPVETIDASGDVVVLACAAYAGRPLGAGRWTGGPLGDWEEDGELFGPTYAALEPAGSDWRRGQWTFAEHQDGPVRITGRTYDLMGSAADALEAWAARLARDYDVSLGDQGLKRSQPCAALLEMASRYRLRQPASSGKIGGSDRC